MKILIATPTKTGRTKVGLNIGYALVRIGHQVRYFDYDLQPISIAVVPRKLRPGNWQQRYLDFVNNQLIESIENFTPEIFLCVKGVQFSPDTIEKINSMGIITVGYWIDDPLDHARSLVNASAYQYYFTNDASSIPSYKQVQVTSIAHLPSAADAAVFYPLPTKSPLADIIFIGTHSPYREQVLIQLQHLDLRVYGPGWKKSKLRKSCIYPEAFGQKTNILFNRAKINLNIHNWFGKGTAMNLRLFEVPAAGGFLLTDWVAEIDAAYEVDKDLACWWNVGELQEKIKFYLDNENLRMTIAQSGYRRFLLNHSYDARVQQLLNHIQ